MNKTPTIKYYQPTKAYGHSAIKRQWHCVRLEIKGDQVFEDTLVNQALWIEDSIGGKWWSQSTFDALDDGRPFMGFYFANEEDAVLFQFAWGL